LLSSPELNDEIVHIQDQQRGCTGLTAEVRHAELARDRQLALTLKMGMEIRDSGGYPLRLNGAVRGMPRTGSGARHVEYTFDAIDKSKRAGEVKFDVKQNGAESSDNGRSRSSSTQRRDGRHTGTGHLANRSLGLLWPRRWTQRR
jgi:hypothetical protein